MSKSIKVSKPINVKVADLSDEELKSIVSFRKKIENPAERESFIKGLYFISAADEEYSLAERELVEGTACALGFNEDALNELIAAVDESEEPISTFAYVGGRRFKELLFEEMGAMTYLKGYQSKSEDDLLKEVASALDISDDKAEKVLMDLYMQAQGFTDGQSKSTGAKIALGIGGIAVGATICALTAGVAAPAIGAAIGNVMGLSGAAATNAGLALLGGGALSVGGGGVAAGTAAVVAAGAVVGGGTTAVAVSVKENISNAYDKKKLKAMIKKQQKDNMTKQEITDNLIKAIALLKERLVILENKQASMRDIASVNLQIANLEAQKAELELEAGA